jgi:hypothetical protein
MSDERPTLAPPYRGPLNGCLLFNQSRKSPLARGVVRLDQIRLEPTRMLRSFVPLDNPPPRASTVRLFRTCLSALAQILNLDAANVGGFFIAVVEAAEKDECFACAAAGGIGGGSVAGAVYGRALNIAFGGGRRGWGR